MTAKQALEAKKFQDSGLLWWVNRMLHLFGWSIIYYYENDDDSLPTTIYPQRTKWRGFEPEIDDNGFKNLTKYLKDNAADLEKDLED